MLGHTLDFIFAALQNNPLCLWRVKICLPEDSNMS